MKFGICVNLLKKDPTDVGIDYIEKIAEWGYDYIELPVSEMMLLSDADFAVLKDRVQGADIPCRALNSFFPPSLKLTGKEVDHQAVRAYYSKAMSRANALGAKYMVFGSPWSRAVPAGFSMDQAYQQLLELIRQMGTVAAENNVVVAVEHNNHTETNILNQLNEVGKLVVEVNHPHIKVLVDYYHIRVENEPIDWVIHYGDLIVHSHFARFQGRGFPTTLSEDELYIPYIKALHEIQYKGGVSIEAYSDDLETDAPATLQFLKTNFMKG